MYEQLEFEYDPPVWNSEVALACMSDYGPYWSFEDNYSLASNSLDYVVWIEDHYGNLLWGDRDESDRKHWGDPND